MIDLPLTCRTLRLLATIFAIVYFSSSVFAQTWGANAAPKIVSGEAFEMPPGSEEAGIDGILRVAVKINKDGRPTDADVVAGPSWPCGASLDQKIDAVRDSVKANVMKARFSPRIINGNAVEDRILLRFLIGKAYRDKLKEKAENAPDPPSEEFIDAAIDSGVVNGSALSLPKPAYPYAGMGTKPWAIVEVSVLIGLDGKVISAGAISGPGGFHKVSRSAACRAKFSPTTLNGVPVKVSGTITYTFVP